MQAISGGSSLEVFVRVFLLTGAIVFMLPGSAAVARIVSTTATFDDQRMIVGMEFDEPVWQDNQWTFQLFIDRDSRPKTGYGWGYELVVRGMEMAAANQLVVRDATGVGASGGWGVVVGDAYVVAVDDYHVTVELLLSDFDLSAAPTRFEFETYLGGARKSDVANRYTQPATSGNDCNGNGINDDTDLGTGFSQDCNKNGLPDECDLLQGRSTDCDGDGIPDECEEDCNANGVADLCDLATGFSYDTNANSVPDECEGPRNRYLPFVPLDLGQPVAYRLRLSESDYFPEAVGLSWWLDVPNEQGVVRLVDTPTYFNWSGGRRLFYIGDCPIVPAAQYVIEITRSIGSFFSVAVVETIRRPGARQFGDAVGMLNDANVWTGPDGIVSGNDILACIAKFERDADAPHMTVVDLHDEVPNGIVNASDILMFVAAFQLEPYPFSSPGLCQ